MIGALAGDLIGSVYERYPIKTTDFPLFQPRSRFTDDSVLTVAIADAILRACEKIAKAVFLLPEFEESRPLHEGNDLRRILYSFLEKNLKY